MLVLVCPCVKCGLYIPQVRKGSRGSTQRQRERRAKGRGRGRKDEEVLREREDVYRKRTWLIRNRIRDGMEIVPGYDVFLFFGGNERQPSCGRVLYSGM